jgi:NAD(P) transhydrogenase subunit alpha
VGVPRETHPGERRVALVPAALGPLLQARVDVLVESGAGEAAGYRDAAYAEKGAAVASRADVLGADVLLQVRSLAAGDSEGSGDLSALHPGQTLIGLADPLSGRPALREVASRGAALFALELLPRTTRAQTMDALSSQATIAGYKAVALAAERAWKIFPKLTTAAGTLAPVRAFVVGAGVAGLQAIATARRLGAVVEAYDVRPAVREQVESVGARFVELPLEGAEGGGGYAREMDESFYRRQRETMARVVAVSDVVITTAAVPGRRAPMLITSEMVDAMAPGSVIVDLAAAQGGNCEVTVADEVVVRGGVTILGPGNLAASAPFHASQLYARNLSAFLLHHLRDGVLSLDAADEITRETLVAHGGEIVHPRVREALGLGALAGPLQAAGDAESPAARSAATSAGGSGGGRA